jgi:hypothetical protein
MTLKRNKFARRERDGVTDSICLKCYSTVGNSGEAGDIEQSEAAHRCNGFSIKSSLHPEAAPVGERYLVNR